jgi:hypothetical protein
MSQPTPARIIYSTNTLGAITRCVLESLTSCFPPIAQHLAAGNYAAALAFVRANRVAVNAAMAPSRTAVSLID